jgi:hypothetical protein
MTRPYVKDRNVALALGIGLPLAGLFFLRDAYERRNAHRPWWFVFIPGA